MEWLRIGEVSRLTGLTQRTLRHYDDIGLLVPSGRSHAEYRLYSQDDLRRLLAIQHLKSLGLSLDDVASALDNPDFDAASLIRSHAAVVEERIAAEQELLRRLRALERAADSGWELVVETIALAERLRHPDGYVRFRAALTGHTVAPTEELVELLRTDPEPGVREAATWALVQQGTSALPAVLTLAGGDEQARHSLAHVLGKFRTAEAVPHLGQLLSDASPKVASKAAFGLGQIGGSEAADLLASVVRDERPAVRDEATAALIKVAEAGPVLRQLARDESPVVRLHALEALGLRSDPVDTELLIDALHDQDADVRFTALMALGSHPGDDAHQAIAGLAESSDDRLRLLARRLLLDRG